MRMIDVAISQLTTARWELSQEVACFAEHGFESISIWRSKLSDIGIRSAVTCLRDAGLRASSLQWAGGFTGSDGRSFAESVADAAGRLGFPLLITTVDHALLKPEWITQFLADTPDWAEVAVLLAPEARVQAAAPQTKRTYLKFRDGRYSGCNLFLLRDERAMAVVTLWRKVEALRKQPWKIAAMLGPSFLIRYALGLLPLDQAVARLGALADVKAAAVRAHDGLAAVDVDKPSDLDLVRELVGGA